MYNSKGPTGKKVFKPANKKNVKADRALDKKKGIKEGSVKDTKIDKTKFGKKV